MAGMPPTLNQFIRARQQDYPDAIGEFSEVMNAIALGGKLISREINLAGLVDATGYTGRTNVQGEEVAKLDEWSNDLLVDLLGETKCVCVMGSEEVEGPIVPPESASNGRYAVLFDPVDGSSNIDIAAPVGTIFSIQRRVTDSGAGHLEDLLQPGKNQAAAGYILYGSSTMFVYTTGQGVHAFTLDPTMGEFHLTTADLRFPEKSNVYSTNEGNAGTWREPDLQWIDWIKKNDPDTGRPYSARYIGALVADFHRILLKGGIFAYPGNTARPDGKLRLLYECSPMAFIAEQAGGAATNGTKRILDIEPSGLHQRTPYYIGTAREVELIGRFHGSEGPG
ncbi:MAG: class 1 fructose-bisphosphatase [Chloroflexi bacterium]|nr:class 1 fructose-bisphosphatase [Chloroflexota bacterium]